jgi:hypothetical protein
MRRSDGFEDPPASAAWVHEGARIGFETVFVSATTDGWQLAGTTAAIEGQTAWIVGYEIEVDRHWRTRTAEVWTQTTDGRSQVSLRQIGPARWTVNGARAAHLDGCVDVDLESSACTNTLPVHRLASRAGLHAVPAAYVRVENALVERLEQTYVRTESPGDGLQYAYTAPQFDFSCQLVYDRHGLVVHYPGIARRVF